MHSYLLKLNDDDWRSLKRVAKSTDASVADCLRMMICSFSKTINVVSAGANIRGVYADTTSGKVWIAKGF